MCITGWGTVAIHGGKGLFVMAGQTIVTGPNESHSGCDCK